MRSRQTLMLAGACIFFYFTFVRSRSLPGGETTTHAVNSLGSKTVKVDFYGESLCPDCRHMVLDVLTPLYEQGIGDLVELRYIAYGNVRNGQCQHGPPECHYNKYINCAQALKPNVKEWFPLIQCLAQKMTSLGNDEADECAQDNGFNPSEINACVDGDKGAALEKAAAEETNALQPKHNFVPWIVVNGIAIGGDFENLGRYVCAAAVDADRPTACYNIPEHLKHMSYG